jgi:FAD/FMN-containing dehydrogenase
MADLQAAALARGLWLPLGLAGRAPGRGLGAGRTIGDAVDRLLDGPSLLARATARDLLLEAWAVTGDGRDFHVGAAVFKNVAGYDLPRLLCGADGRLARLRAVTLQLRPAAVGCWACRLVPAEGGGLADEAGIAWLSALARAADPLAGLQAVIERGEAGRWLSAVAIGGGPAPAAPDLPGVVTLTARREAFAAAAELLDEMGADPWCRNSGDWATWQPLAGTGAAFLPRAPRRLLWQHAPRMVWTPETDLASDRAWLADVTCRAGASEPLPTPTAGVPRHVLQGLKRCFDPAGALGGPPWLVEAGDA